MRHTELASHRSAWNDRQYILVTKFLPLRSSYRSSLFLRLVSCIFFFLFDVKTFFIAIDPNDNRKVPSTRRCDSCSRRRAGRRYLSLSVPSAFLGSRLQELSFPEAAHHPAFSMRGPTSIRQRRSEETLKNKKQDGPINPKRREENEKRGEQQSSSIALYSASVQLSLP